MSIEVICESSEQTFSFGQHLSEHLSPGDFVGLTGQLGAGKTLLVRGVVDGLWRRLGGKAPRVCSPSYTMANTYQVGPQRVHHMDLYRVSDIDDLESTGYWDMVEEEAAMTFVEWLSQVDEAAPRQLIELEFTLLEPDDPHHSPRRISVRKAKPESTQRRMAQAMSTFKPAP